MRIHPRLWWLSVVIAACGIVAFGLPGIARAATTPAIVDLQSPSHPSDTTWYSDANPTFSWAYGGFANQYASVLDHSTARFPARALRSTGSSDRRRLTAQAMAPPVSRWPT